MKRIVHRQVEGSGAGYRTLLALLALFVAVGALAAWYVDHYGHQVTGMTNRVAWPLPHVFSMFLILAGAGAFNVAAISAVFGRAVYAPLARLSCLLALALLVGGLSLVMLDLGRPDRIWVAMSHFNFKSTLATNFFRYIAFSAAVAAFLWTRMDPPMNRYSRGAGVVAMLLGLAVSTGIGLEFGFLVAREAYDSAVMAPMFVALSLSLGLAFVILVMAACYGRGKRPLGGVLPRRLNGLLGVLVGAGLYFVTVHHLTALYAAEHRGIERFLLLDGGVYTALFWVGQVLLGGLAPLFLIYHPKTAGSPGAVVGAAALVVIGGLAQIYVVIIGGQAYPMVLFPGLETAGVSINPFTPSLPEVALGLGGIALSLAIVAVGVKVLALLPESLADADIDPHHRPPGGDAG